MTSPSSALRSPPPAIIFRRIWRGVRTPEALLGIGISTAIVCGLLGLYIGLYLTNLPGSAAATRHTAQAPGCIWPRFPRPSAQRPTSHLGLLLRGQPDLHQLAARDHLPTAGAFAGQDHDLPVRRPDRAFATRSSPRPRGRSAAPSRPTTQPRDRRSTPPTHRTPSRSPRWGVSVPLYGVPPPPRTRVRTRHAD